MMSAQSSPRSSRFDIPALRRGTDLAWLASTSPLDVLPYAAEVERVLQVR